MKRIVLKEMHLTDWRGQNISIHFNEYVTKVYGKNKAGKSTLYNAFLWLLLGCDSQGRLNYNLFDNNREYTPESSPEAAVEATIEIDDIMYSFKRTAEVGWVRNRGCEEYVRKGTDNYKYFIDSIEVTATRYKEQVAALFAPTDMLKVILIIDSFFGLDWQEQRRMLGQMAGEIKEDEYVGDYSILLPLLSKLSIPEVKAKNMADIKVLKEDLKSLQLTIPTMEANLPNVTEANEAVSMIKEYRQQIADIDKHIAGAGDAIKPLLDKRNKELADIYALESSLQASKTTYLNQINEAVKQAKKEIADVDEEYKAAQRKLQERKVKRVSIINQISQNEEDVERCNKIREELLAKKDKAKAKEFNDTVCAYCGQELPIDKIEELKKNFYEEVEKNVQSIIEEGRANNRKKETLLLGIDRLRHELEFNPEIVETPKRKSTEEVENYLAQVEETKGAWERTEFYIKTTKEIEEKRASLTVVPKQDNSKLLAQKNELMDKIQELSKVTGLIAEREKQIAKIEQLKKESKETSAALAEKEMLAATIKQYEEEKAQIISEKVNKYFDRCQISMHSVDKSGNIVPDCVIKGIDGAISTTANGAERILMGIDVSNAFSKFLDISIPLFVDDINLVDSTNEIKTNHQLIELIVSDNYETLVIE